MQKDILRKTIELRHVLHEHPELSMQERQTKGILMQFLKENTSFELVDQGNWFYAVKHSARDAADKIAFRADMDALPMEETIQVPYRSKNPGISHKCGHDGHMAVLCGLRKISVIT